MECKEWDFNGRLLFDGECKNKRKCSGRIKNYYKNELIFEGEYLEGKIWNGKGKEIDYHGNITFEGEYINGEKNSYIKKYNYRNI